MSFTRTGHATNLVAVGLNFSVWPGLGEKCKPQPHSLTPPSQSGASGFVPGMYAKPLYFDKKLELTPLYRMATPLSILIP